MDNHRIAALAIAALCLAAPPGLPREAAAAPKGAAARHGVSEASAQRRVRRAPLRINVYPREILRVYPWVSIYPRPDPYDWPGPNAQRDCISWLAPEARPSGTVIVPQLRCRWVAAA